jgi:hypothetical protein
MLFLIVEVPFVDTLRRRHLLPPANQPDGFFTAAATHLNISLECRTHGWTLRLSKNIAQILGRQLQAAFTGGFALGHSGNRRTDGRGNATSATALTAFHDDKYLTTSNVLKDGAQSNR